MTMKYSLLPGFRPRLKELFVSGFQYIPYFLVLVYQTVRLLPPNHPYMDPHNIGKFGVRHVIAEAANNLVLSFKNLDQIVLFVTIIFGFILVAIQIGLLAVSVMFQPVMAAMPTNFAGFFITPAANAPQDIAYILLDLVFGIPGLFQSCIDPGISTSCLDTKGNPLTPTGTPLLPGLGWPHPIHEALHQMLQLYSIGLLVVAAMITSYFIVTIVAETAQTGTAFGKRFNKVWAPIRLVVAFGLLIPAGYGLNSSQYIVLYAAKFGSGFATNGWNLFNTVLADKSYLGAKDVVSQPNVPEVNALLQFMYVARVCKELVQLKHPGTQVKMYLVRDNTLAPNSVEVVTTTAANDPVHPYAGAGDSLLEFGQGATSMTIRFGVHNPTEYTAFQGFVFPTCGDLTFNFTDPRKPGTANPPDRGPEIMQRYYWYIIQELWSTAFNNPDNFPLHQARMESTVAYQGTLSMPDWPTYRAGLQNFYKTDLIAAMVDPPSRALNGVEPGIGTLGAINEMRADTRWGVDPVLSVKGWAGAGIWYNRIAELNGSASAAVLSLPTISRYPAVMEYVLSKKKQNDSNIPYDDRFEPKMASGQDIQFRNTEDSDFAKVLNTAYKNWVPESGGSGSPHTQPVGNALIDAINALLGTEGLYSMRRNPTVHPLSQLVGLGRSLIEASVRNSIFAGGQAVVGIGSGSGVLKNFISGFMTIATMAMTIGFTLFYVLPFLPFIYFFFAVGGWIKAIFEAMVGAPLWALAHIRIDGDGLPGQAAVAGYYMIFEIFLRPILIVFGFLASISIFAALVSVLNETWTMITANVSGYDVRAENEGVGASLITYLRGPVDEFFFTVMYAIVVYMLGMSSFKLIDIIPNNILRWMGQSVSTFNDQREDAAQGLMGTTAIGTQQVAGQVAGGVKEGLGALVGGRQS